MEKDELYYQLISIAEEKSEILDTVKYDPEVARLNSRYVELEQAEKEILIRIKEIEDNAIIENSFLLAYNHSSIRKNNSPNNV